MTAVRFMREVGTRAWLRIYWGNAECGGSHHNAMSHLVDSEVIGDWTLGGDAKDHAIWPANCADCGAAVPTDSMRHVFHRRLYEAQDGSRAVRDEFVAGDMYWADWYELGGSCEHAPGDPHGCVQCRRYLYGWTNCDGRHLIVEIPDGLDGHGKPRTRPWDVDSRASNCDMREETTHRCWVRHGDPETGVVHVDKAGNTCHAGAGSIATDKFHGHLHYNVLAPC